MSHAVELGFDVLVLLIAGVVRGFSGFGFALVAVSGLSLVHPPAVVVPTILCLEILASVPLLRGVWSHAHWNSIVWLLVGMGIGTAPGAWLLAHASPATLRLWVSLAVLFGALALTREAALPWAHGVTAQVVAGICSGLLNASASIGGPPVILYYLSSPARAEVVRASLIAFFVVADVVSLVAMGAMGLLTHAVWMNAALWLLPSLLGVHVGRWVFERYGAKHYRPLVVGLLALLALLTAGRAAWDFSAS
ncbi:hypothetical protein HRbin30_02720 [bacterium HR30]|nr:hypothetical protein HRbin30_02720 [bacterium HR30]